MNHLKKFGFTLVEMMMTVIILGILVSIAIPNYMHSMEIASCSQGMAILTNMRTAELDWFRQNGVFTNQITDLEDQVDASFADTKDWDFNTIGPVITATTFTLTATRLGGPHIGNLLTINELGVWAGTYPFDEPSKF